MEEKYVLIKPYEFDGGSLPEGSEIVKFRGRFYFNGGMVSPAWNDILSKVIVDEEYVRKMKITKNTF